MIKRFIVLTFFFVAGMALGLAATNLLARSLRTPPSHLDEGSAGTPAPRWGTSQPSDPIGIEASHRLVSTLVAFRRSAAVADTRTSADRGTQLTGAWNLNRDLSDDPRANPAQSAGGGQPGRRGGGGGFGGGFGGFGGRRGGGVGAGGRGGFDPGRMEAMQEVLQRFMEAPRKLTIVERDGEIVITDDDGRTQDLKADGHKVQQKMANGLVSATRKTDWNGASLVTEIEIENGPTIVQTYARSEGGSQLVVTTKMNAPRGGQPREIKYVYDPADSSLL